MLWSTRYTVIARWPPWLCQFGPGLCFYPEFRVPVRSSEKGLGRTLVWSSGLEFRERHGWNPGSAGLEFGKRNESNPGSAGSEFREKTGLNPCLAGLKFR